MSLSPGLSAANVAVTGVRLKIFFFLHAFSNGCLDTIKVNL